MGKRAAGEVPQGGQLLVGVVDAGDEGVLVGRPPSRGVDVGLHGIPEAEQRPALDAGHEDVSRPLDGRVEGDGQGELLGLLREAVDLGNHAARGDGEVPGPDAERVRVVEEPEGLERLVIVREGLALPHENDAAHPGPEVVLDVDDLLVYLLCDERARKAAASRGAERAVHRTTSLRGGAHREAVAGGHAHALDGVAVGETQEVLSTAVDGDLSGNLGGDGHGEARGEVSPKRRREVGHLVEALDVLVPEPVLDLFHAKRWLAEVRDDLGYLLVRELANGRGQLSATKRGIVRMHGKPRL